MPFTMISAARAVDRLTFECNLKRIQIKCSDYCVDNKKEIIKDECHLVQKLTFKNNHNNYI